MVSVPLAEAQPTKLKATGPPTRHVIAALAFYHILATHGAALGGEIRRNSRCYDLKLRILIKLTPVNHALAIHRVMVTLRA